MNMISFSLRRGSGIFVFHVMSLLQLAYADVPLAAVNTCGVDSLYQVSLLYDMGIPWERVAAVCQHDADGSTLLDVSTGAERLGLPAEAFRLEYKDLLDFLAGGMAAIVLVRGNHFVVVRYDPVDNGGPTPDDPITVLDYPNRAQSMARKDFETIWSGEALVLIKPDVIPGRKESTAHGPAIEFKNTLFDFGEIRQDELAHGVFTFENRGNESLVIENLSTSCSCTAAVVSATTVPPGESGGIRASFHPGNRRGRQTSAISVHSNDKQAPETRLILTGIVKAGVQWSPRRIDFGQIPMGQRVARRVVFLDDGSEDLNIPDCRATSPHITFATAVRDGLQSGDNSRWVSLDVVLDEELPLGTLEDNVVVQTNQKVGTGIVIPIRVEVVGNLEFSPPVLFFGRVKIGQSVTRPVTISERIPSDLEITRVTGSDSFKTSFGRSAGTGEYVLTVSFTPQQVGTTRDRLVVETNHPEEQARIDVYAQVEK